MGAWRGNPPIEARRASLAGQQIDWAVEERAVVRELGPYTVILLFLWGVLLSFCQSIFQLLVTKKVSVAWQSQVNNGHCLPLLVQSTHTDPSSRIQNARYFVTKKEAKPKIFESDSIKYGSNYNSRVGLRKVGKVQTLGNQLKIDVTAPRVSQTAASAAYVYRMPFRLPRSLTQAPVHLRQPDG